MSLISLPPDLQAKIDARIESGAATDAIDVVRAGLEALEKSDAEKLEAIRAQIRRAIDDPRPSVPADEVFDRIEAGVLHGARDLPAALKARIEADDPPP